jgi:hypothetical protein
MKVFLKFLGKFIALIIGNGELAGAIAFRTNGGIERGPFHRSTASMKVISQANCLMPMPEAAVNEDDGFVFR